VLPDGKSFERSDEDERLIGVFKNLFDSVDAIPPSQSKRRKNFALPRRNCSKNYWRMAYE
jgi:hypothetical protein